MKRQVLVVDDDRAILEVLEMRLAAMSFDVTAVSDPRRALEVAGARRFDLALLDLRMEPMNGVELMEALHARQRRLPVLIMTAHGTIENAVEAVQHGAFDYLTKPFARDELQTKIGRALATRRWARDRERLLTVGQALASSGVMERVVAPTRLYALPWNMTGLCRLSGTSMLAVRYGVKWPTIAPLPMSVPVISRSRKRMVFSGPFRITREALMIRNPPSAMIIGLTATSTGNAICSAVLWLGVPSPILLPSSSDTTTFSTTFVPKEPSRMKRSFERAMTVPPPTPIRYWTG